MSGLSLPHASSPVLRDAARPGLRSGVAAKQRPAHWLAWMALALHNIGTRRELARMDARMLKDIGLSRSEALEEAGRAPWDIGQPRR